MLAPVRIRAWLDSVRPQGRTVRKDALAGLPGAIASVPDGMASAVLVGVNPIHGLYASAVGPVGGGLFVSTRLMVVTTTTAAALAAGSALQNVDPSERPDALFLLTLIAGVVAVAAGVARLGRYVRFVSVSVMLGFLTGVAANIVFGQIPDLTGASAKGPFALAKAWDVVVHPGRIDTASLLTGLASVVILLGLARTRLGLFASIVALVIPTVATLSIDSVARVEDVGKIGRGIPLPHLPDLGALSFSVIIGALAVAAIVVVQGAGVSEAAPNPGGRPSDPNGDFVAQGAGNILAGLFRGQPVGGSVGQTSLNLAAGARTRWGSIFAGLWMVVVLGLFSGLVGHVAMPTLAAILIVAAVSAIRVSGIETVFRTGLSSQIALITTFLVTLFLPAAAAVGIGVALSLLLQLNREALDLAVVRLVPLGNGRFEERQAPKTLESGDIALLDVYGSLYYAGARTLETKLPDPRGAVSPVVIVRLRGRTALGATSFVVLARYANRLAAVGGRLFLSGVDPRLVDQFRRAHREDSIEVFAATPVIGDSSARAYRHAQAWLRPR